MQQLQPLMGLGLFRSHPLAAGKATARKGPLLGARVGGGCRQAGVLAGGKLTLKEKSLTGVKMWPLVRGPGQRAGLEP